MLDHAALASHDDEIGEFAACAGGLEWSGRQETLILQAWGLDGIRVRSRLGGPILPGLPGALLAEEPSGDFVVELPLQGGPGTGAGSAVPGETSARLTNGAITAEIDHTGRIVFRRTADGSELLAEHDAHFWWPGPRPRTPMGNGYHRIEQHFAAYPGERLYGLGQHQHGLFDQKGAVIELIQRNSEVSIPFLLSNRGYGLLWNNPAVGRVELAVNGTRWVADSARQLDYWITAGTPGTIVRRYADATGHTPVLPDWAAGFWQCKLRYRSQEELLEVAREYQRRGVPLSVIVCDFFHWTHLGDWKFDPAEWPDPAAAVKELDSYGTKLMVSVWPSVSPLSENHEPMERLGLLVGTEFGSMAHADWPDKGIDSTVQVAFYDATNPKAREYVWSRLRDNYLVHGIELWWADACEPEIKRSYQSNLRYHAGPGQEVANLYPRENSRMLFEGMHAQGRTDVVTLNRSAWAGSQRYGAVLWSGDIAATFASLRNQIAAGLNTSLSGIPWWNTDIGGFHGGDPDSPAYRELMIRWFQFGAFSPIMRLHGARDPIGPLEPGITGGPNEIWSYGEEAYGILAGYVALRERLRPYVLETMRVANEVGLPPMRPLFLEFPDDAGAWDIADSYLFGADLLVAPVLQAGATSREVYLPAGAAWTDAWTSGRYEGGQSVVVDAPLDRIPVFLRDGRELPIAG